MNVGDHLTVSIEKPAAGGRMIARHDGSVLFVAGAIPGERVEVAIERVQRGIAWATTVDIAERSPDRVDSDVDRTCGGNVLAHVAYERQRALKRDIVRDAFERLGRLSLPSDLEVVPSPPQGYRMRARLHVVRGRTGFYREGTHELCDASTTRQLLPESVEILRELEHGLARVPSAAAVSEVELSENCSATERALHLVLREDSDPSRLGSLPEITGVRGVSCRSGPGRPLVLWGTPSVTDTLDISRPDGARTVTLVRQAHSFFQGNRYLLQTLVDHVLDAAGAGRVLDLYAGVGLFSVALAARGHEVVAVEGDRNAAEDLKTNASGAPGRLDARHQSVEAFVAGKRQRFDTVVVDPPRTGMTKQALNGTLSLRPSRLVYVSCDVATLARDARRIVDAGYTVDSVRAFDLFPNTAHVETVIRFTCGEAGDR